MAHRVMKRLVAGGAIGAFALSLAGPATAHSRPETTAPANGEVVAAAPAVITISFDKPMRVTTIELTGAHGEAFALERTDEMAPLTRFEAIPPPLPAGHYEVEWRGLSADGHPMRGRFSFEVPTIMLSTVLDIDAVTGIEILVKTATYAACLAASGSALARLTLSRLDDGAARATGRLAVAGAVAAAALSVVRIPVRASFLMGGTFSGAFEPPSSRWCSRARSAPASGSVSQGSPSSASWS